MSRLYLTLILLYYASVSVTSLPSSEIPLFFSLILYLNSSPSWSMTTSLPSIWLPSKINSLKLSSTVLNSSD